MLSLNDRKVCNLVREAASPFAGEEGELDPGEMASRGSRTLGVTEMKGSWFAFDDFRAHEDWCRWRAPFWHGTRVRDPKSHANYHLGFRCCRDVGSR